MKKKKIVVSGSLIQVKDTIIAVRESKQVSQLSKKIH